jgi:hypothetical protein
MTADHLAGAAAVRDPAPAFFFLTVGDRQAQQIAPQERKLILD